MKKFIVTCMLVILGIGASAQTRQGQSSFGVNLGYGFSDHSNVLFGLDYRYNFTDEIRLAPSFSYFVKENGLSACAVDVNAHYVIPLNDVLGFYPLAGLDLSFWNLKIEDGLQYHENFTRFGVNLGLGAEVYATDQLTVGLEFRYNLIKDFDQAILGVRIGYNF